MNRKLYPLTVSILLGLMMFVSSIGSRAYGQDDASKKPEKTESTEKRDGTKPYDEVITEEAKTHVGLFFVHRLDEKVYYEIPPDTFGKDMLWVTQIEQTQAGHSYAGSPVRDLVVRWELRGEKTVLLRGVHYTIRADGDDPIKQAVEATSLAPIIKAFPIKAWGKDKAPVIDVTGLFTSEVAEFSAKRRLQASDMDSKRSFIEEVKCFPENIETKILATYKLSDGSQSGLTVLLHHSMVKLHEKPMKPRVHDDRIGFFTVRFEDYSKDNRHQVEEVRYVTRWRLEKKDPDAEVSEPKKPIVFYVGRGVPEKWKPWVKKGIEMWQPAFAAAGFKNAIIGKLAPSPREDPNWDAEDARISSIRWLPATVENAFGPHVHDPRTGEILEADVRMYHNVLKLVRDWYFVQASPSDPRAQKLPLPDDLMGELLAFVVAHEVGHSLGFPHNMKASSSYSVEQLRDPEFTKKNGTAPSIMDYARFNYVAQPGDGASLIPRIGRYDFFAVKWGYTQFKDEKAEKQELAAIVKAQIEDPMLRFGANRNPDPSQQTEDLGSDAVAATELGLKNLSRVFGYLVDATCQEGEDYTLLRNMYDQILRQRSRELGHVVNVVGGFTQTNLRFGDANQVYFPVEAEKQREAVAFICKHALQTPPELVEPAITLRLEPSGAADRVLRHQRRVLTRLITESRIKQMAEHTERTEEGDRYSPTEMLADVRAGIWGELERAPVAVDLYRRNLQRAHVEHLASFVEKRRADSDVSSLARMELQAIREAIAVVGRQVEDHVTAAHLADIKARIQDALDPRRPRGED